MVECHGKTPSGKCNCTSFNAVKKPGFGSKKPSLSAELVPNKCTCGHLEEEHW
jgi:hypothetical protein